MPVSSVNSKEDLLGGDEPTRFPPDYARRAPHREVEGSGEETLEEEAVGGGAPRGGGGGGRGSRGKKLRAVSEIGGSSSMPSYTEAPSESEEEEYVPDGEEEEAEEEGEEEEAEEGGGEVDPALWGDLPPGAPQGWLRGNAGLPTPPSIEEHKWLIEPVGTE